MDWSEITSGSTVTGSMGLPKNSGKGLAFSQIQTTGQQTVYTQVLQQKLHGL